MLRNRLLHWAGRQSRSRRMHPDDPGQRVCHETIHTAIHAQPRESLNTRMIEVLRQAKPKPRSRRIALAGSAMVPETMGIIHRPEDIEARLVPGHWEGDLIRGAFNRSVAGTVVGHCRRAQRRTRLRIAIEGDIERSTLPSSTESLPSA